MSRVGCIRLTRGRPPAKAEGRTNTRDNFSIRRGVIRAFRTALFSALCLLALSCARQKTITREELRSDLTSAISIANETELAIDFVTRGQTTRSFATAHLQYLANQLHDSMKELAESTPERGLERNLSGSRKQVDALARALHAISSEVGNPAALSASKRRVDGIRSALEYENSAL